MLREYYCDNCGHSRARHGFNNSNTACDSSIEDQAFYFCRCPKFTVDNLKYLEREAKRKGV